MGLERSSGVHGLRGWQRFPPGCRPLTSLIGSRAGRLRQLDFVPSSWMLARKALGPTGRRVVDQTLALVSVSVQGHARGRYPAPAAAAATMTKARDRGMPLLRATDGLQSRTRCDTDERAGAVVCDDETAGCG